MEDKKQAIEELAEALGGVLVTCEGNWEHMGGTRESYREGARAIANNENNIQALISRATGKAFVDPKDLKELIIAHHSFYDCSQEAEERLVKAYKEAGA